MAEMDDFGSAFTGQSVVEPAQAASQWDDWLQRPGNRTALLQMGLQMMQPVGIGQTVGGHIAQSIGAGGEAVARQETSDLKERVADAKMQAADERLRILQQNADSNATRAAAASARGASRKVGGLMDLFRARAARQDAAAFERQIDKDAGEIQKRLDKQSGDILNSGKLSDDIAPYKGKSKDEIKNMLRASRPKPKFGSVPEMNADDEDDDGTDDASTPVQPAAPNGARLAPDGNYYVPDPKRPGKYLRVTQ
jgi:hypothetical protein